MCDNKVLFEIDFPISDPDSVIRFANFMVREATEAKRKIEEKQIYNRTFLEKRDYKKPITPKRVPTTPKRVPIVVDKPVDIYADVNLEKSEKVKF